METLAIFLRRPALVLALLLAATACGGGGGGDDRNDGTLLVENTRNRAGSLGSCGETFTVTRQGEFAPVFVQSVGPCQSVPLVLEPGIYQVDVTALGGACSRGGGFHQTVTIIDGELMPFPVGCESCSECP